MMILLNDISQELEVPRKAWILVKNKKKKPQSQRVPLTQLFYTEIDRIPLPFLCLNNKNAIPEVVSTTTGRATWQTIRAINTTVVNHNERIMRNMVSLYTVQE